MKLVAVVACVWGVLVLLQKSDARPPVPAPVFKAVRSTPWHRAERVKAFAREQHRRRLDAERTRLERIAEDNMPRPALHDIPDAVEHLAKIRGAEELVHLEQLDNGKCDDCKKAGARFSFLGKLGLCVKCVGNRLRVREQQETDAA